MNRITMLALFMSLCLSCMEAKEDKLSLVPLPKQVQVYDGTFNLRRGQTIGYADALLKPAALYLQGILAMATGYDFAISQGTGTITLSVDSAMQGKASSYRLDVQKKSVGLVAKDYQGVICGISTIRQLLPKEIEVKGSSRKSWTMPLVTIADEPYSEWRGMHLDVSRHFFNVGEVEEFLDLMALYKFNKFHWHLTDDQGWRIEIKHYPLLTQKGAWRKLNNQDSICLSRAKSENNPDFLLPKDKMKVEEGDTLYGGFYTQEDIRRVVRYAQVRGIDVVPEVDMPGHILCALQSYDGISCFSSTGWGETFSSPLCPGKESALEFCRNVYGEICGLFPYKYIHLGADEVDKANWEKCPDCQKRIKALNLKDEKELQAWFVKYMEMFLNSHNKRLLGWDEIAEGGLSKSATITWWRSWVPQTAKLAFDQGNDVIICPTGYCYLSQDQNNNSLKTLYITDLYDRPLTERQKSQLLGLQGALWSERIPTRERLHYQAFPRALAIAEKGWTAPEKQKWEDFSIRIQPLIDRMYDMGINYHPQELDEYIPQNVFVDKRTISFKCQDKHIQVRYTTDGSVPTMQSKLYTAPFTISESATFTVRLFSPKGRPGTVYTMRYSKQPYSKAYTGATKGDGIAINWYDYNGEKCSEVTSALFNKGFVEETIQIPSGADGNVGLELNGYLDVPADDVYTFSLLSDDGSMLYIDGQEVINSDGPHSAQEVLGQAALAKGLHKVTSLYFDHNGGVLTFAIKNSKGQEIKPKFRH